MAQTKIKTRQIENLAVANITDLTATATEINYTDGVTSAIQTQVDLKAPLASPTFTGTMVTPSGIAFIAPALGTPASGVMTNATGTATGLTSGITNALKSATTTVNVSSATAPSNGQALIATSSTTATWQTLAGGGDALVANPLSQFAATTSAQLLDVISDETGTGALVFGSTPTLTTPVLGVATATSINKMAITAPATSSTLTVANGKTLTANNSLTLAGTDSTTMTFPSTNATIARTDAANTFTGVQAMTSPAFVTSMTTATASFTALAGATTLLTIGGTGASASMFAPSTLDASSSTTGAIRTSGGISAAKAGNIGTTLRVGGKTTLAGTDPTGATYTPATGAQSVALDVSLNNMHIVSGHASGTAITFTITGATNNQPFIVSILQGGTIVSTIVGWFATVRWAGGTIPTLTATLNKRDTFGFIRTGTNTYDGFIVGQNC